MSVGDDSYCDVDPTFSVHVDDDFDTQNSGISRKSFCSKYLDWIQYCASRREKVMDPCHEKYVFVCKQQKIFVIYYCRFVNFRENLIFANIREFFASRIQSSR